MTPSARSPLIHANSRLAIFEPIASRQSEIVPSTFVQTMPFGFPTTPRLAMKSRDWDTSRRTLALALAGSTRKRGVSLSKWSMGLSFFELELALTQHASRFLLKLEGGGL